MLRKSHTTGGLRTLEKAIQKRKSTLKKSASQLEILCGAQVCCVWLGPTGNVEVWPENEADAVSIITKYKQCRKKTKLCKEASRSNIAEQYQENKGLVMRDDNVDQSLSTLENSEEDYNQYLNSIMENVEPNQNKVFDMDDDIDQFRLNCATENVKPNEGFDQFLNYEEENRDCDLGGSSFFYEGLDNLSSKVERVDQRIESVDDDELNNGLDSNEGVGDHELNQLWNDMLGDTIDLPECPSSSAHISTAPDQFWHDFLVETSDLPVCSSSNAHISRAPDQFWIDILRDTIDLPECSSSNAHISTAPGFKDDKIDDVSEVWPWETSWPSLHYTGLEGAQYLPDYSTNFENDKSRIPSKEPGRAAKVHQSRPMLGRYCRKLNNFLLYRIYTHTDSSM